MSNVFGPCKLAFFDKFVKNFQFTRSKHDRVKAVYKFGYDNHAQDAFQIKVIDIDYRMRNYVS